MGSGGQEEGKRYKYIFVEISSNKIYFQKSLTET